MSLERRMREVTDHVVHIHNGSVSIDEYVQQRNPVIRQGEEDDRLFRIVRGDATIVRHSDDGPLPLAKLRKGDFFGAVPFYELGQEPGAASVFGSEDLETEEVDPGPLQTEYDRLSATFKKLIEHTATSISVTAMVAQEHQKKAAASKG
jgi:hypothetical protein